MKILLVQTGFIGDVILSTPLIANLRRRYPDAELSILTTPQAAPLLRGDPALSEVLVFDKRGHDRGVTGLVRMSRALRARRYDCVFSLHKSFRTAFLLAAARIPIRYGFKEASLSTLYSRTVKRSGLRHEVLRNLMLLEAAGEELDEVTKDLSIVIPQAVSQTADELLSSLIDRPLVGLAPGSVWATKRWTTTGFAQVADALAADGYGVVLIGGPDDADTAATIESRCTHKPLNLVGRCSLIESAAVISKLRLLVTNDSAPLHLGSAVGTPIVALFCATVPEFGYGPWNVPHEVVGVEGLSCRPCGRHGGQLCPTGTYACMEQLQSRTVLAAASRLLGARAKLHVVSGGAPEEPQSP